MIWIILPAYNEEEALPILLDKIKKSGKELKEGYRVIVVDDGSNDKTKKILEKYKNSYPLEVITHNSNIGLGKALFNGLQRAVTDGKEDDIVITLDADNTHPPSLFMEMIEKIQKSECDIVIASRYENGGDEIGLSSFRKVLSRGASTIIKLAFKVGNAKDCTCGFRAYNTSILRKGIQIYGNRLIEETSFVCMAELLIKLSHIGAVISEVPLVLRYDMKKGNSKMKYIYTIWRYFNLVLNKKKFLNFPET